MGDMRTPDRRDLSNGSRAVKALVIGISGQDGAYLARLLLGKGYTVIGTSRDAETNRFDNLARLGIGDQVQRISMSCMDVRSITSALTDYQPDEIYFLAGQTSVGLSFGQPHETLESIAAGTLNVLESIRFNLPGARFYNAGSSESFGDTAGEPATEATPFRPLSPYASAKAFSFWLTANYREAYGIFACTGLLFNHESPLRPRRFVTQKIVYAAASIAHGRQTGLELGNIAIERDWGWAPDYVDAMWRMLQQPKPADFVIATGRSVSLGYFVERVFACFGLDWNQHVRISRELYRPTDITSGRADPSKAHELLGWTHTLDVDGVITHMCKAAEEQLLAAGQRPL
jgi:GDPmannose 4,6-dehydratase